MNTNKLRSVCVKLQVLIGTVEDVQVKAQYAYKFQHEKWKESEEGREEQKRIYQVDSILRDMERAMIDLGKLTIPN
jgi:hypothetical protein